MKKRKKENKKIGNKIFIGIAGEHFVAAEISKRGAIATITLKNVPNIDILASSVGGKRTANIQVKTGRFTTGGFIVGRDSMETLGKNFFYVFVLLKNEDKPEYWILPQSVVAKIAGSDYAAWIKERPAKSKNAPITFKWKYLNSKSFQKYHNNWKILGLW